MTGQVMNAVAREASRERAHGLSRVGAIAPVYSHSLAFRRPVAGGGSRMAAVSALSPSPIR